MVKNIPPENGTREEHQYFYCGTPPASGVLRIILRALVVARNSILFRPLPLPHRGLRAFPGGQRVGPAWYAAVSARRTASLLGRLERLAQHLPDFHAVTMQPELSHKE